MDISDEFIDAVVKFKDVLKDTMIEKYATEDSIDSLVNEYNIKGYKLACISNAGISNNTLRLTFIKKENFNG